MPVLAIVALAVSVGLSNFGASVGIGIAGIDRRSRRRLLASFWVFETGMPLVGLIIGHAIAGPLGSSGRWISGGLLVAVGAAVIINGRREVEHEWRQVSVTQALAAGLLLSIDNLVAGFALGAHHVGIVVAVVVLGAVSVAMAAGGFELGRRLNERLAVLAELIGGLVLIAIGIAVLAGWL